jgi:hypothetical protein
MIAKPARTRVPLPVPRLTLCATDETVPKIEVCVVWAAEEVGEEGFVLREGEELDGLWLGVGEVFSLRSIQGYDSNTWQSCYRGLCANSGDENDEEKREIRERYEGFEGETCHSGLGGNVKCLYPIFICGF